MAKIEITKRQISEEFKIIVTSGASDADLSCVRLNLQVPTMAVTNKVNGEISFRTLISYDLPRFVPNVI